MDWLKKAYATVGEEMTQYVSPKKPIEETDRKVEDSVGEERKTDTASDTGGQVGDGWDDWHTEELAHPGNLTFTKQLRSASFASVSDVSPSRVENASGQSANASPKADGVCSGPVQQAASTPRPAATTPRPAATTPRPAATTPKAKTQLESLSKEDLVKYVKKQAQFLQKSKGKNDELMKRISLLEVENKQLQEGAQLEDIDEKLHTVSNVRDRLAEQLQSVVTQHEQLRKEHKAQTAEFQLSCSERDELNRQRELLQIQCQTARQEKEDVEVQLTEMDQKARELEKQVAQLSVQTVARLEREVEESKRLVESLQAQLKESEASFAQETQKQLKEYSKERQKASLDIEQSEKLSSQLSAEVDALKVENNRLQAVIQEKEKSVDEVDFAEKQHLNDVEQLNGTIKSLQEQLREAEEKIQRLESELAKSEREGTVTTRDVDGQVEQLARKRDEALKQLEESKKHADALLSEIESMKKDYGKEVTALQEEEIRSRDLASEKEDLDGKLKEAIGQQERLQQQLKGSEDERLKLLSNLQQSEKLTSELSAGLEAARVENGRLLTELQERQLQIDQVKIEAERQYHCDVEKLSGMTGNLERELQESKSRVCQLESQLADSVSEGTAQRKGVNDQLRQVGRERAEALIRLEESEKYADELSAEVEGLRKDLQNQLTALQEKDLKMKELLSENETAEKKCKEGAKEQEVLRNQITELRSSYEQTEQTLEISKKSNADSERRIQELTRELAAVQSNLETQQKQLVDTEVQLKGAVQEAKQSTVMDLELADYQRTIESLEQRIRDKDAEIATCKDETAQKDRLIDAIKRETQMADQQRDQTEERAKKMKVVLVKTKKELSDAKKEIDEQKQHEAELKVQVEMLTQGNEEGKVQVAALTSQSQALQQQIRAMSESHHRSLRSLEQKLVASHNELESTKSLLAASQSEFEAYKVRVHSVLKQQKAKSGSKQEAERDEADRQRYQTSIDQLKKELNEANESLVAAVSDREELEEELDRLSVRHDKLIQDSSVKETQWRERVEEVRAAAVAKEQSYHDNIKALTQENESLAASFKEQLKALQQDHRHTVEVLQQQVAALEDQQNSLKGEIRHSPERRPGGIKEKDTPMLLTEKQKRLSLESDSVFKERQQAEGMDQLELESLTLTTPGSDTLESPAFGLERLLSGSDEGILSMGRLDDVMKQQLRAALKRIEHLTGVLRETEASSLRLTEQARVLKDEIRRLERNQARDEGLSNFEYLKNVVLKFLQTTGSEQEHLIPVMTTLLKLSPEEIQMVTQAVKGDDSESTTTTTQESGSGWSTYVHRWTGF